MNYTRHARSRSQKRGIPGSVIDVVLAYGTPQVQEDGTEKVEMYTQDKERAIRQLRRNLQALEKTSGVTVVTDGNAIITVYRDA